MKKGWLFALIFVILFSGTALAAEDKPVLKQANIEVSLGQDGVEVVEHITLANVEAIKEGKIKHIFTQFENAEVEDLVIKAGEQELSIETQEGNVLERILVSVPSGIAGDFSYTVAFRLSVNGDVKQVPLVVPAVAPDAEGNDVSLTVTIPEGQYLQESFPIIDSGKTGTLKESMMNVPNFLKLQLGSSPAGFFTATKFYMLLGLIVILGLIGAWLISERKAKTGGVANV